MTVDGQYGYHVTEAYPWVMSCFSGAPDASFRKQSLPPRLSPTVRLRAWARIRAPT